MRLITKELQNIKENIPNFIDTRDSDHKKVYECITNAINILELCLSTKILSERQVVNLHNKFYAQLTLIHKTEVKLYQPAFDHLKDIYVYILYLLVDGEYFEAAENIKNIITYEIDV